ncbi:hypothetical protein FOZ62_012222 [Perkinsus olseni]|uniref:Uncharacterized protein n=1 Tax=Perkinsus olseni TaxID=32597 RepID=A0A7J6TYB2_PEROL|nr:hypothetical protein FOZ62_012222 [Perkinsus olseni]
MRTYLLVLLALVDLVCSLSGCSSGDDSGDASAVTETLPPHKLSDPNAPATFPKTTGVPPTPRPASSSPCTGHPIGIYSWSQDFWREGDPSLTDFIQTDRGRTWDCGELYINVADASNYDKIVDQDKLVNWMKKWRQVSGNDEVIWMTYGDVVEQNGTKMVRFVKTFKDFLLRSVSAEDMAEIAPIGISFDVEHVPDTFYKEALTSSREMVQNVTKGMGYLPHSILVGSTIEGEENQKETTYVMQYADRALMMLYRNAVNGSYPDDLVERMRWMMTDQCVVCTKPGWENLRAKITIMVEGSCKMGHGCGKLSMCVEDTSKYPDPNGGIEYVWNTLQELTNAIVPEGILTQDQYNKLFLTNGTLYAIHNWDWSRCFYGDDFSREQNYTNCQDYHTMAATCRTK